MRRRILAALAALVLLPLGLLSWLGFRAAGEEYGALDRTYRELVRERLAELEWRIGGFMDERRRSLRRELVPEIATPSANAGVARRDPLIMHSFAQSADGRLLIPAADRRLTESERLFLQKTQFLFDGKILLSSPREQPVAAAAPSKMAPVDARAWYRGGVSNDIDARRSFAAIEEDPIEDGWYSWFAESDIRLVYWRRLPDKGIVGCEISRIGLLSELVGMLPETTRGDPVLGSGSVVLADAQGRTLYRWGAVDPAAKALETIPLTPPLRSWTLQFTVRPGHFGGRFGGGLWMQVISGLGAVAVTLLGLAWFLYREHTRDLRDAGQRVSFVNQVSHELKTPLTNIRLYAELLEESVPEDDQESRRRLEVIVTESRRLGRLIANVLSFSKRQNGHLEARLRLESPDQRIRAVIDSFRPSLEARQIAVALDLGAGDPCPHDPDILEQILGNLIGNIEKYAGSGGRLIVKSRLAGGAMTLWVRDFGPGIPGDKCDFVFTPFARLSDRLDEGVSGTGIGLTIARDLARIHGGDLTVVFSNGPIAADAEVPEPQPPTGCCFKLVLSTIAPESGIGNRSLP